MFGKYIVNQLILSILLLFTLFTGMFVRLLNKVFSLKLIVLKMKSRA